MAGEIRIQHPANTAAATVYALLWDATSQVCTVSTGAFGAYATVSRADYKITMTEKGTASRLYAGDVPANVAAGDYVVVFHQGSGSEGDPLLGFQDLQWSGTAIVSRTSRATQTSVDAVAGYLDTEVAAIKAKTDNLPSDPADASDIAASFSTVNSTLATIAGYLDTEVAAILAAVDTEVGAIKTVTDAIGATGTGLSAIPWNAAWDTEVQSECADALTAYDGPTNAEMEARTILAANYFDPAVDVVAHVTLVDTCTTNTDLVTAAANAAALMDLSNGVETGLTPRQALRLMTAALAGKLSGAGTTTITIRNTADSKDRIIAVVDTDGNRSSVTLDVS